jgi:hypothetical protein
VPIMSQEHQCRAALDSAARRAQERPVGKPAPFLGSSTASAHTLGPFLWRNHPDCEPPFRAFFCHELHIDWIRSCRRPRSSRFGWGARRVSSGSRRASGRFPKRQEDVSRFVRGKSLSSKGFFWRSQQASISNLYRRSPHRCFSSTITKQGIMRPSQLSGWCIRQCA